MTRILIAVALATCSSAATAQAVNVTLSEWKIGLSRDTVRAGAVTFQVTNRGAMSHGFFVTGNGVERSTRDIAAREAATLTLSLKPGTYELYCPMSEGSHKAAGMERTLIVTAAEAPPPAKNR